jgi:hypothetical protein
VVRLAPPPGLTHAVIGLMTSDQVHFGRVHAVHAARQFELERVFAEYLVPFAKPTAAWINRPAPQAVTECRPSHSGLDN